MTGTTKFGVTDFLACLGYGFAVSFLLCGLLWVTAPQILAGGHTEGAGGLDNLMAGVTIVFLGGGILFSLVAAWVRVVIKKRTEGNSSDDWWPPPPL